MENNQHKDFDQFFQNKLNNRQFDYQDDFWTEMESQLPQSTTATTASKGESRKRFLLLLLLLIGFSTLIGWFNYPSNNTFITKGKAASETETKTKLVLEKTVNSNVDLTTQSIVNQEENSIINNENPKSSDITNNNNTIPSSIINTTNTNDFNIDDQPRLKLNENDGVINTKGSENITSENQPIAGNNENESERESESENIAINSKKLLNNTIDNESRFNSLLIKRFSLENNSEQNEKEKSNLIKPNCDGCPILPPSHQFKIGLIAGLNTSLGYKNIGDSRANPSFDPTIGLRITYRHSMTSPWRTNVEAIYSSRSALNAQIGYDSISYGFGSTIISRNIDIEELHYISVPIYATYQYKKKHSFMGGLSFGYLMNAQSQTSGNITETTANDANLYTAPTTQEWGYTTAFNRFDFGATLGYDYEVQKGWKVGARFNYGLRDITKNNIFNNNIFDNNTSLRLIMTCDLFIL